MNLFCKEFRSKTKKKKYFSSFFLWGWGGVVGGGGIEKGGEGLSK